MFFLLHVEGLVGGIEGGHNVCEWFLFHQVFFVVGHVRLTSWFR